MRDDAEIESIVYQLLALVPSERRASLDDLSSEDDALREHVEARLTKYEEAEAFVAAMGQRLLKSRVEYSAPDGFADPYHLSGQRVGRFIVEDCVGGGGMGLVYRAIDSELRRPVALKFLPPEVSRDLAANERFKREAIAASKLDHPNIATIHEIGTDYDGRLFIAMAYYEGQTLREKIVGSLIDTQTAIRYAIGVLHGLSHAHANGVTHRDIKPANVMITANDEVKILDFGLARMSDATVRSRSPLMGTVAYMSPEQVKGEDVDGRTDIWSLGVVLYEMLAGRKPFGGRLEQGVINLILSEEPTDIGAIRPELDEDVTRMVSDCLKKDPRLRPGSAGDLATRLASSLDSGKLATSNLGSAVRSSLVSGTPVRAKPFRTTIQRSWTRYGRWIVLVLGIGILGSGVFLSRTSNVSKPQVRTYYAIDPKQLTGQQGWKSFTAAISPDGSRIAFNSDSKLWIRSLNQLQATPVPKSEGSGPGFEWSPDGVALAFGSGGLIHTYMIKNGQLETVGHAAGWWRFRLDGSIAYLSGNTIHGPVAIGATVTPLTVSVPGLRYTGFAEIPGQKGFIAVRQDSLARIQITHLTHDSFRDLVSVPDASDPILTSAGHLLFTAESASGRRSDIWGITLNLNSVDVTAGPTLIASNARHPSTSDDGRLLYLQNVERDSVDVVILSPDGKERNKFTSGLVSASAPALSPDGRYVSFDVDTGSSAGGIWILDRRLGAFSQLTFNVEDPWLPTWSPDSRAVAYQSTTRRDIYVQSIESGSEEQLLVRSGDDERWPTWSSNGDWIVFTRVVVPRGTSEIWRVRSNGEGEPEPVVVERFSAGYPSISPDDRYVAYTSNRFGKQDIFVSSYPEGERHARVTNRGAGWPKWRGNKIYFVDLVTGDLMSVRVTTTPQFRAEAPETILAASEVNAPFRRGAILLWDVSKDGTEIVLIRDHAPAEPPRVVVTENWEELLDI